MAYIDAQDYTTAVKQMKHMIAVHSAELSAADYVSALREVADYCNSRAEEIEFSVEFETPED